MFTTVPSINAMLEPRIVTANTQVPRPAHAGSEALASTAARSHGGLTTSAMIHSVPAPDSFLAHQRRRQPQFRRPTLSRALAITQQRPAVFLTMTCVLASVKICEATPHIAGGASPEPPRAGESIVESNHHAHYRLRHQRSSGWHAERRHSQDQSGCDHRRHHAPRRALRFAGRCTGDRRGIFRIFQLARFTSSSSILGWEPSGVLCWLRQRINILWLPTMECSR